MASIKWMSTTRIRKCSRRPEGGGLMRAVLCKDFKGADALEIGDAAVVLHMYLCLAEKRVHGPPELPKLSICLDRNGKLSLFLAIRFFIYPAGPSTQPDGYPCYHRLGRHTGGNQPEKVGRSGSFCFEEDKTAAQHDHDTQNGGNHWPQHPAGAERWLVSGRRPGWTGDRNSRSRPIIRSPPPHYSHVGVILGAKEVLGIAKEVIHQHVLA